VVNGSLKPISKYLKKQVNGEDDEQSYHKMLKEKYNHLIEPYTINKKKKVKLYKLNPVLMQKFDGYNPMDEKLDEPKKIDPEEKELIEYVESQKESFIVHLDQFKNDINGDHYEYLIMKEKTKQIEIMKSSKVEMEKTKQEIEKSRQIEAIEKTKQMELQLKIIEAESMISKKS
jgi:hypothetical protein